MSVDASSVLKDRKVSSEQTNCRLDKFQPKLPVPLSPSACSRYAWLRRSSLRRGFLLGDLRQSSRSNRRHDVIFEYRNAE